MWRSITCLAASAGTILGLLTLAVPAWAACDQGNLLDAIPPDGAQSVPTNTPLTATYDFSAKHHGEEVIVRLHGEESRALAASYNSALRTLTARLPEETLTPNAKYTVQWPPLSSNAENSNRGSGASVTFSVGSGPDASRPSFAGIGAVHWDFERVYDSCSKTESERYLFDLKLAEPHYSGGVDLLSLVLFQTEGPTLNRDDAGRFSPEPVYTQRYSGNEWVTVKRPVADGVGRVCFSAIVQAPSGLISDSAAQEVCTTTIRPPFFDGCMFQTMGGSPPPGRTGLLVTGLVCLLGGLRRLRLAKVSTSP